MLGLAFTASAPVAATAALGVLRAAISNGDIAIGAQNNGTLDATSQADATITFGNNGRVALAQLIANPAVAINTAYSGAIEANLPVTAPAVGYVPNFAATWQLGPSTGNDNPLITGAAQAATLDIAPANILNDPTLDAEAMAGLPTLVQ
jgi:hypothetical protein